MKTRKKIYKLLDQITSSAANTVTTVSIIGETTSVELYRGTIWEVPFSFCIDYVKSYKIEGSHLGIFESRHSKPL